MSPISDGLHADFAVAEMVRIAAALGIFIVAGGARVTTARRILLASLVAILLIAAVATSHSVSRMTDQIPMALADAIHQLGASIWIGGIPYFIIALGRTHDGTAWRLVGKRFSQMSMASVAGLIVAGLVLAYVFVGSWQGLYGTSYGVMVIGKVGLLGILLGLGGMNFLLVERLRADPTTPIMRMRRFCRGGVRHRPIGVCPCCLHHLLTALDRPALRPGAVPCDCRADDAGAASAPDQPQPGRHGDPGLAAQARRRGSARQDRRSASARLRPRYGTAGRARAGRYRLVGIQPPLGPASWWGSSAFWRCWSARGSNGWPGRAIGR